MKRKKTDSGPIGNIIKDVIKSLSGKGRVGEEEIYEAWRKAAGDKAAGHTKPVSIKKSVLTVNVDGSGWLYELTIKKKELLEKLDGHMRQKKLKGLRFRIGEIKKK
jgi:predicted nucleic acid-binding Zn ribbon protein